MPKVYNKYHGNAPSDAVYIGRGSPWGNPFVINRDGDRDEVCDKFEAMVEANPEFKQSVIDNLKGKDVICFCAPNRCLGDYLVKIANEIEDEKSS